MRLTTEQCWQRVRATDHAVLCTTNATSGIDAVPVCFAAVGDVLASPIDLVKPKETTHLARLDNLDRDAGATLLFERWDRDDWSKLWWVKADLVRRPPDDVSRPLLGECDDALRQKYRQYVDTEFAAIIVFDVATVSGWSASPDPQFEEVDPVM